MLAYASWLSHLMLLAVTAVILVRVYRRTHLVAVLAYLLYVIVGPLLFWPVRGFAHSIVKGNAGQWLGATIGERLANYSMFTSAVGGAAQTALFVWLILSLVHWSQATRNAASTAPGALSGEV